MRTTGKRIFQAAALAAVTLLATSAARADVWLLKNGRYLEGKLLSETVDEITIETTQGGISVKMTIARGDILKHVKTSPAEPGAAPPTAPPAAPATPPAPEPEAPAPEPAMPAPAAPAPAPPAPAAPAPAAPEAGKDAAGTAERRFSKAEKVIFLLDASGSMLIGGRFQAAVERIGTLIRELEDGARFDVVLFNDNQTSLFDGELRMSERVRGKVGELLNKAAADPDDGTDLRDAIKAVRRRRPDVVVLLTDGVPTLGEVDLKDLASDITKELERSRSRIRLDVAALLDGVFADPKVENLDASAKLLAHLAKTHGGIYEKIRSTDDGAAPRAIPDIDALSESGDEISSVALGGGGFLPRFNVRITDDALEDPRFRIREYPGGLRLVVKVTTAQGLPVGSPVEVPLSRDGRVLHSAKTLTIVGPQDARARRGSDRDHVYIPSVFGGHLLLVYERAGASFTHGIALTQRNDVIPAGAVVRPDGSIVGPDGSLIAPGGTATPRTPAAPGTPGALPLPPGGKRPTPPGMGAGD